MEFRIKCELNSELKLCSDAIGCSSHKGSLKTKNIESNISEYMPSNKATDNL